MKSFALAATAAALASVASSAWAQSSVTVFRNGCLGTFWMNSSATYEKSFGHVSFGVQYSVPAVGTGGKHPWNMGVSYADGPLYIGVGHEASNDGSSNERWTSFAANYDLG